MIASAKYIRTLTHFHWFHLSCIHNTIISPSLISLYSEMVVSSCSFLICYACYHFSVIFFSLSLSPRCFIPWSFCVTSVQMETKTFTHHFDKVKIIKHWRGCENQKFNIICDLVRVVMNIQMTKWMCAFFNSHTEHTLTAYRCLFQMNKTTHIEHVFLLAYMLCIINDTMSTEKFDKKNYVYSFGGNYMKIALTICVWSNFFIQKLL